MIKATNLTKTYHTGHLKLDVLKGLNMHVKTGEFVAITGKSGSGKSTLLYQLSCLDHPTSGEIYIDKTEITKLKRNQRSLFRLNTLGYVFQDYALLPSLSAIENVMIPLLMQGNSQEQARHQAVQALTQVGLADKLNNLPSQLSGGQQQRVSIARAIGNNPKVLFADEPTANLDSDTSLMLLESFKQLHDQGQTILMVTHEDEYAKQADRILTLQDGVFV